MISQEAVSASLPVTSGSLNFPKNRRLEFGAADVTALFSDKQIFEARAGADSAQPLATSN